MPRCKARFLINCDLHLGKGKIAAQVGHAAAQLELELRDNYPLYYKKYKEHGNTKIVLKANETQIKDCLNKYGQDPSKPHYCFAIYDLGLTQCKANSLTVLAFYPTFDPADEVKDLKLY